MSSAISTSMKHEVKNTSEKLSSHKKIKITADTDKIIEHTSSASYSEIYSQKVLKSLSE